MRKSSHFYINRVKTGWDALLSKDGHMYGIIYLAECIVDGKCYTGQTKIGLDKRRQEHEWLASKGKGNYFQKALIKHGFDSFIWRELCDCYSKEEICGMETYYIIVYETHVSQKGYNLTWGGEHTEHSLETRKKLSEAGRNISDETRQKLVDSHMGKVSPRKGKPGPPCPDHVKQILSEKFSGVNHPMYGVPRSEETKVKIREKRALQVITPESRQKTADKLRGFKHSPESIANMCKGQSNRSEETRRKMSESAKKKPPMSEETRRKLSASKKGKVSYIPNEDTKKKIGNSNRGKVRTEETKQKLRDAWVRRKERSEEATDGSIQKVSS